MCKFNFEEKFGEHGKDFIHVHHLEPIAKFEVAKEIDPESELTVLCPNCHAMVHRSKDKTLSLDELKEIIKQNNKD